MKPVDDHTRDLWNQAGVMVSASLRPATPEYMSVATMAAQIQAQSTTFAALVQMDLANQIRDLRKEAQP